MPSWFSRFVEGLQQKNRGQGVERVESLALYLHDPDVAQRIRGVKELGKTAHPLAAKHLLNAFKSTEHERVLIEIVEAAPLFSASASHDAVSILARAFVDSSLAVRFQALRVAESFPDALLRKHKQFMAAFRELKPNYPEPRQIHQRLLDRLENR